MGVTLVRVMRRTHLGDLLAVQVVSRLCECLQAEGRADHDEEKRNAEQCRISF